MQTTCVKDTRQSTRLMTVAYAAFLIVLPSWCGRWLTQTLIQYSEYDLNTHRLVWFIVAAIVYATLIAVVIYVASKVGMPFQCFPFKFSVASKTELFIVIKYSILAVLAGAAVAASPMLFHVRLRDIEYEYVRSGLMSDGLLQMVGWSTIMCIVDPVIEEIAVRGVALKNLLMGYGVWPSIVISSALWAFAHSRNGILIFLLGILFGYVTIRIGSLTPALLGHITTNLVTVLLIISSVL